MVLLVISDNTSFETWNLKYLSCYGRDAAAYEGSLPQDYGVLSIVPCSITSKFNACLAASQTFRSTTVSQPYTGVLASHLARALHKRICTQYSLGNPDTANSEPEQTESENVSGQVP
jgi:hypothetical protein